MAPRKFIIDTSLFVNPHARIAFGKDPKSAAKGFIKKVEKLDAEFFMPPSVFRELNHFVMDAAEDLEMVIKKRAPNLYGIYLPAAVFYNFIDDVRGRINKGLRLAEEFAKDNAPDNDAKLVKLRDKYRDAMRSGIVDSKEDFELVLLAKELDATLVSADEGIILLANQVGCEWINATKFGAHMKKLKKRK
jgi:RNA ligase partner protein